MDNHYAPPRVLLKHTRDEHTTFSAMLQRWSWRYVIFDWSAVAVLWLLSRYHGRAPFHADELPGLLKGMLDLGNYIATCPLFCCIIVSPIIWASLLVGVLLLSRGNLFRPVVWNAVAWLAHVLVLIPLCP
ncbi:MAG: hypothetical protein K6T86_18900 [Pirellulales bacterium]|nr:hypothetical protein [Pirellulales bacterium]